MVRNLATVRKSFDLRVTIDLYRQFYTLGFDCVEYMKIEKKKIIIAGCFASITVLQVLAVLEPCPETMYKTCQSDTNLQAKAVYAGPNQYMCIILLNDVYGYERFEDASHRCEVINSKILHIPTVHTNQIITGILNEFNASKNTFAEDRGVIWINLKYVKKYKSERWVNYPDVKVNYPPFYKRTKYTSSKQCYYLDYSNNGTWFKKSCTGRGGTVCVRKMIQHNNSIKINMTNVYDKPPSTMFEDTILHVTYTGDLSPDMSIGYAIEFKPLKTREEKYNPGFQEITKDKMTISYLWQNGTGSRCMRIVSGVIHHTLGTDPNKWALSHHATMVVSAYPDIYDGPWDVLDCGTNQSSCIKDRIDFTLTYGTYVPRLHVQGASYQQGHVLTFPSYSVLMAHCSACVGKTGYMTWLDVNTSSSSVTIVHTKHQDDRFDCGIKWKSTLVVRLSRTSDVDQFTCATMNVPARHGQTTNLFSDTKKINVLLGPGTPTLEVNYHNPNGHLILGRNLSAKCTACLGEVMDSRITWFKVDVFDTAHELNIAVDERTTVPVNGTCVKEETSSIVVPTTKDLDRCAIMCRVYGKYLDRSPMKVYSQTFIVFANDTRIYPDVYNKLYSQNREEMKNDTVALMIISLALILIGLILGMQYKPRAIKRHSSFKNRSGGRKKRNTRRFNPRNILTVPEAEIYVNAIRKIAHLPKAQQLKMSKDIVSALLKQRSRQKPKLPGKALSNSSLEKTIIDIIRGSLGSQKDLGSSQTVAEAPPSQKGAHTTRTSSEEESYSDEYDSDEYDSEEYDSDEYDSEEEEDDSLKGLDHYKKFAKDPAKGGRRESTV